MELTNIRREIDRLDAELVRLLCERLDYSRQSAAYKKEHGLNVFYEDREREVLEAVAAAAAALDKDGCGYDSASRVIYSTVVEVSRSMQYKLLGAGAALRRVLEDAIIRWEEPGSIVCQGVRGTFSDDAAQAIFPNSVPRFVNRRDQVIKIMKSGETDYGLLPVKDETLHETFDYIEANGCYIASKINVQADNIVKGGTTQFFVISPMLLSIPNANRTTVRFRLPHTSGALYHTLGRFALESLNIMKLESRPSEDDSRDCAFYLEFDGNVKNPRTADLLCALSEELEDFAVIGNYRVYTV